MHEVLIEGMQHAFASCELAAAQYAVLLPYCMLKIIPKESPNAEWRSMRPGRTAMASSLLITAMRGV